MNAFSKFIGLVFIGAFIAAVISLLIAWPVQLLWNALIPSIFDLRTISFFEALGLSVLCSLLFKSHSSSSSSK
jgi:hypothetical protein